MLESQVLVAVDLIVVLEQDALHDGGQLHVQVPEIDDKRDHKRAECAERHTHKGLAFVLYGIIMAGVFEECGRHIVLKYIMKKNRTPENAVMYGIGHGGIEILAVLLPSMILYLVIAVLFSAGNIENALSTLNITEQTAAAALPSVEAAAAFDYAMMAMNVLERLFAMLLHIGLTVVVYYGVCNANKACLPIAILLHMLMDTFPALYQRGVVALWAVEIWAALWTAVIVFVAVKLYRKMKAQPMNDSV